MWHVADIVVLVVVVLVVLVMQILVVCCIMSGRRQLVGSVYFKTVASSQMFHSLHLENTFGLLQLNLLVG